jgi:hypothetical protein
MRVGLFLGLAVVVAAAGCSSWRPDGQRAKTPPRPPTFEEKVAQVEPGLTDQEQVKRWFGEPASVGKFADGGVLWHFRYVQPAGEEALERCKPPRPPSVWKRIGDFVFHRPRQPRPLVTRRFPARIHELELRFTPDGVVDDLSYQHNEGTTLCAT